MSMLCLNLFETDLMIIVSFFLGLVFEKDIKARLRPFSKIYSLLRLLDDTLVLSDIRNLLFWIILKFVDQKKKRDNSKILLFFIYHLTTQ